MPFTSPLSQMINRWFPIPFTSASCSAAQRISKPHMFLQCSRFPVWEWPPEGQTLASSSSSCYLQVKGDGLLERRFPLQLYWIHTQTSIREDNFCCASENTKVDKILWGRVDTKEVVFTKTSPDTSRKFITISWPQEEVSRCKGGKSQMGGKITRYVSLGLMRSYSMQSKGYSRWFCLDSILYVSSTACSLKMIWIDFWTDEINLK